MKLSEAILLGSMNWPQCNAYYEPSFDDVRACCALGAAWLAVGKPVRRINLQSLENEWPWTKTITECPQCKDHCAVLTIIGWHLGHGNPSFVTCKDNRWTRERIAAWVATIEPQEAPVQAFVPEPESVEIL